MEELPMTQPMTQPVTQGMDDSQNPAEKEGETWGRLISMNPKYGHVDLTEDSNSILLGRHPSCHKNAKYDDVRISAKHARIYRDGPTVYIEDLSSNGTYVDGELVGKGNTRVLTHGSELSLVVKLGKTIDKAFGDNYVAYLFQAKTGGDEDDCPPDADYLLGQQLGTGNFSVVRLGIHKRTGEKFAIKIITKTRSMMAATSSNTSEDLLQEFELLKRINHPNIVGIKEFFENDRKLFLVMELANGGDLFDLVTSRVLTEAEVSTITSQMLSAVQYLHSKGIVHRDLKPENVLMMGKGSDLELKLSDFGIAKIVGDKGMLTTFCGTPQYFAPEVLRVRKDRTPYGKEVDLWSLGVVLYILLVRRQPFSEDRSMFGQIENANFTFEGDDWKTRSAEAKDLVANLIVSDPEKRFTCEEALNHPFITGNKLETSNGSKKRGDEPDSSRTTRSKRRRGESPSTK